VAEQVSWCRAMANLNPRITVEPGKMGGKPCIRGLRFTVYDLASYLASGMFGRRDSERLSVSGEGRLPGSLRVLRQHSGKDLRS
jgi:hypothetical protein